MASLTDLVLIELFIDDFGWRVELTAPKYSMLKSGCITIDRGPTIGMNLSPDDVAAAGGGFWTVIFLAQEALCARDMATVELAGLA